MSLMPPPPAVDAAAFLPEGKADALADLDAAFTISTEKLHQTIAQMKRDMRESLEHEGKTIPMIPSYVTSLPTGDEKGTYLALDLGGTNLRVCEVQLHGGGKISVHEKKCVVEDQYKTGSSERLFDFMAEFVGSYLQERGHKQRMGLGFTFSFSMEPKGLDSGICTGWSKGYSLPDAVGKDVVRLLRDALKRKNVDVKVMAVLNDTVGTMVASAYEHYNRTVLAFIFGTGTNAAYAEKLENVGKWKSDKTNDGFVLINTEWGAFDEERRVLPYTKYDEEMDAESPNPGEQRFEKLISGMYLGEIVRRAMADLAKRGVFSGGNLPPALHELWGFDTKLMAAIESDTSVQLKGVERIFKEQVKMPTSLEDRQIIHRLCQLISLRSARLSAAAIAAVLSVQNGAVSSSHLPNTLAGDGSVYNLYPGFVDRMKQALVEVMGAEVVGRFEFRSVKDGSGIGAAALAAAVDQAS